MFQPCGRGSLGMSSSENAPEYRELEHETVHLSGYPLRFHHFQDGRLAVNYADLERLVAAIRNGLQLPLEELAFFERVMQSFSEDD